ncbi:glycoside hydrolase family 61 protein-like protein [Geopyxis carbonaria]|nr:glycoside hydrolase family 61 protein-like protein [Geopyxis carbonaria]
MHFPLPRLLAIAAALTPLVSAHYRFAWLTVAGAIGDEYQYIRKNTNNNSPVTSLSSPDLQCNVGATAASETASVAAGSQVAFDLDTPVYHQGPVSWYLGTADGASWFKFHQVGPTFADGAAKWEMADSYAATIPESVPSGEYLLRIEQIALHNPGAAPQFYISCAQITVTGGGSGTPEPTFEIPGHVKEDDPGITVNIYDPAFTEYTFPGPAVWEG